MSTTSNIYSHIDSASKLGSANVIGNVLTIKQKSLERINLFKTFGGEGGI